MHLWDWLVIVTYALVSVACGVWFARRKGRTTGEDYLIAGRRLPWWIVGIADVATGDGGDAYWVYVFFIGGFIAYHRFFWLSAVVSLPVGVLWARYFRRLRLLSPGQLYEERYGGEAAARFRAFSSVYGALVPTSIVLGYVLTSFAQALAPFLGWPRDLVLLVFCGTTLIYTLFSGLLAVAYTDIVQFVLVMTGRIILMLILLHVAGGLPAVLDRVEQVRGAAFLQPYPPALAGNAALHGQFSVDTLSLLGLLLMGVFRIASTTGDRGAAVQRALAARDELHAALGQMLNSVLSLIVRTLPMIVVALVAVSVFPPGRSDTGQWADLVRAHVPPGLLGLLLTGIIAGYMSTLDGLVNFGAAGMLNDLYKRFLRRDATDRQQVAFGRLATLLVVGMSYLWARVLIGTINADWINFINSVIELFVLPLALLRWVWWRMNLWGEVVGFVLSFPLSYAVWFGLGPVPAFKDRPYWQAFAVLFGAGWLTILAVTLCTRPERPEVLRSFYLRARPPGLWGKVALLAAPQDMELLARRGEAWHDLRIALCSVVFSAAAIICMGALLSRHFVLGSAMAAACAAAAVGFVLLTLHGERLRRALDRVS